MEGPKPTVRVLESLPDECLDQVVLQLSAERPPLTLARLARTSKRLFCACVERADGLWQQHEVMAFGPWLCSCPQQRARPRQARDNLAAFHRYSARMRARVGPRRALRVLRNQGGSIGRSTNRGLSDAAIKQEFNTLVAFAGALSQDPTHVQQTLRDKWDFASSVAARRQQLWRDMWQIPCELLELYRYVDGEPRYAGGAGSSDPRGTHLLIRGFRLLSLREVIEELAEQCHGSRVPAAVRFMSGSRAGLLETRELFEDSEEAEQIELPLTAHAGSQRYIVRFPNRRRQVGLDSTGDDNAFPLLQASVWLRGEIGDGQQKADSLSEFLWQQTYRWR